MQLSRFTELICVITLILFACFPMTVSAQFATFPEPVCQTDGNRKLIIFIHGWRGNDQASLEGFPTLICGDSDLGSPDVISVNYPTYIFRQNASIAEAADWFVTQIDARQMHDRYDIIIICAHSMGGLIARKMILLKILNDGNAGSFRLLLEFGTPHLGISIKVLDKIARILGVAVDATEEMASDSRFLRGLRIDWNRIQQRSVAAAVPRTECFASPQDEIVPITSAFYQCDNQTTFLGGSHTDLIKPGAVEDDRYFIAVSKIKPVLRQ